MPYKISALTNPCPMRSWKCSLNSLANTKKCPSKPLFGNTRASGARRCIGSLSAGEKLCKTVVPGTAMCVIHAGTGGNGIAKYATGVPMAYITPVNIVTKNTPISCCSSKVLSVKEKYNIENHGSMSGMKAKVTRTYLVAATIVAAIPWVFLFVGMPLLGIWVGNTLFHAELSYTFKNWLAAACALLMLRITVTWRRKVQIKHPEEFLRELFEDDDDEGEEDDFMNSPAPIYQSGREGRHWKQERDKPSRGPRRT